jgi:hypothetical protein
VGVTITIGGTDRTQVIPFSDGPNGQNSWIQVTETVPGSATATMKIYDLTNSVTINRLDTIVVYDTTNSRNVFQGSVQKRKIDVVATYRIWTLSCVDLNSILDTTLVGTPDGSSWVFDASGSYTCVDPSAYVNGGSDAANVQRLFAAYWKYGVAINTTTYVETTNPSIGFPDGVTWSRRTLRQALDDVAALSGPFVFYWIDADAYLHWTTKPQTGAPSGGTSWQGGTAPYTYTKGNLLMLFPQVSYTINGSGAQPAVPPAPYNISDSPDGVTSISYENFSVEYDDSGAALSLYSNGATSYTATPTPPNPPQGVIATNPPGSNLPDEPGVSSYGYYTSSLSGDVVVYPVDNNGVVESGAGITVSSGTSLYTNPVTRTNSDGTTSTYYEIKNTGTTNGYLIPASNPYVTTQPVTTPTPATPPTTGGSFTKGVGGTGWVNDAGPTWLSRFIEEPDASTKADRDAKGTVALQYMSQSIVRGASDVVYPGILYRAGMGLLVTSVPGGLAASLQLIQRVVTTFLSGTDVRRAQLQWGTAPLGNLGLRRQAAPKPPVKAGATGQVVSTGNTSPMPGSTVTLLTQLTNGSGEPWPVQGKTVTWTVTVYDAHGNDVTAATAAASTDTQTVYGWSLSANTSITDTQGRASTQLTLSTTPGLQYFAQASAPD